MSSTTENKIKSHSQERIHQRASKRILFIASHRADRAPSQRFRFEQYFQILENQGFSCTLSHLLSERDDRIFYHNGFLLSKALIGTKAYWIRAKDIIRIKKYDAVFIHREAIMTRSIVFEKLLKATGTKIIYDFDDPIWKKDVSNGNKLLSWFKNPNKVHKIIKLADQIIVGNQYLESYAKQFNNNTIVFPSTVDTTKFQPQNKVQNTITIGWSGSLTTIVHFETIIPVLKELQNKFDKKIKILVVGVSKYSHPELPDLEVIPWQNEIECELINKIDIGIMPLPQNEWTKGKCGMKGLLYMAVAKPTVMSPVGVNQDIIEDGVNGFLANNDEQWKSKLSCLIESEDLRIKLGNAGRNTVIQRFSTHALSKQYVGIFNDILNN